MRNKIKHWNKQKRTRRKESSCLLSERRGKLNISWYNNYMTEAYYLFNKIILKLFIMFTKFNYETRFMQIPQEFLETRDNYCTKSFM